MAGAAPTGARLASLATLLLLAAVQVASPGAEARAAGGPYPTGDRAVLAAFASNGPATGPGSAETLGAAGSVAPISAEGEAAGIITRRIPNPRYRAPASTAPGFGPLARGRIRALDVAHVQVARRGSGTAHATTDWEASLGEESPRGDRYLVSAAGGAWQGRSRLRTGRFEARSRTLQVALGDAPPVLLAPDQPPLHGLRGATVSTAGASGPWWSAAAGGPTPTGATRAPAIRLLAVGVGDLRYDVARFSAALAGFRRAPGPGAWPGLGRSAADTLGGEGGQLAMTWRAPAAGGSLAGRLMSQYHDLDGLGRLAVQHALAWRLATRRLVAEVSDQRSTARLVRVAADRLSTEVGADTRWGIQSRHLDGRAEWHFGGIARRGGDPSGDSRTVQLGGSTGVGRSPWQLGCDANWERREGWQQRRLAVQVGHFGGEPLSFSGRLERVERPAESTRSLLAGELLVPLRSGGRVTLQPRLAWADASLDRGGLAASLTWPFERLAGRLTVSLATGAERENGFRARLSEAGLAFHWAPQSRDRGTFEMRRLDLGERAQMEYGASYDVQFERFAALRRGGAADSGTVIVQVVRDGNRSGIPDVLVSLDGSELRFTDADGVARFDRVAPGIHLVAVEEGSLPAHHQVVGAARAFVQVERGLMPAPVAFPVARPERRRTF